MYFFIFSRLTHDQYNIICAKILNLFPNETAQTYYYSGERVNNLAVQAKGKLVYKAHNILYHTPDKSYVRKRKKPLTSDSDNSSKNIINTEETEGIIYIISRINSPLK